jgi:hypothetical protein
MGQSSLNIILYISFGFSIVQQSTLLFSNCQAFFGGLPSMN